LLIDYWNTFVNYTIKFLRLKVFFYILLLATLCTFYAHAQNPVCRTLKDDNGLPSNTVYNIMQDSSGFMWIAHDKGLCRYDGKQIKRFETNGEQGKSLSNLMLIHGEVYCQDFSGNYFRIKKDSMLKVENFTTPGSYSMANVVNNNSIVSWKFDSIRWFNTSTQTYSAIKTNYSTMPGTFVHQQQVYAFTNKGTVRFTEKNYVEANAFPETTELFQYGVQLNNNQYGITRNSYPYVYRINSNNVQGVDALKKGLLIQGVHTTSNEIWVSTSAGAYCFDENFNALYDGQCFFADASITNVYKDREVNYWFVTLDKGLIIVPNIKSVLYNFQNQTISALSYNQSKNAMFAGTSLNHLLQFNTSDHSFLPIAKRTINHEVQFINAATANQDVLFCSDEFIIYQGNKEKYLSDMSVKCIVDFNADYYAFANSNGYGFLPKNMQQQKKVLPKWVLYDTLMYKNQYISIHPELMRARWVYYHQWDSTLYFATSKGLFYYRPSGHGKIKFDNKDIIATRMIGNQANVYVCGYSNLILQINTQLQTSSIAHQWQNNFKYAVSTMLLQDDWLWCAGEGLLQKINVNTKQIVAYSSADGLPNAEIKDMALVNDKLYLATTKGLVEFNANAKVKNTVPPLLVINSITANGVDKPLQENLQLKSNEDNISIGFSVLAFKTADEQTVRYRINNGEWHTIAQNARSIDLPALSQGNYIIEINAINEDGVSTITNQQIRFTIAVPFFKRPWVIALMVAMFGALIYYWFALKIKNQTKENNLQAEKKQLENELQQSMMASIKSQMNPHFLFNALNTIQSYIYTNDKENASLYLGKFSELTRMILDMSNKEIVSLAEELKALELYLALEQQRFEDKLVYTIDTNTGDSKETIYIPSMLVQPYIENAIKHGLMHISTNWILHISIKQENKNVIITIDDNGIGRKKNAELRHNKNTSHTSFANQANAKRLAILNKGLNSNIGLQIIDKEDSMGSPRGTTVILNIPILQRSRLVN
jgi:ligand-binding sensor domain-containing protein